MEKHALYLGCTVPARGRNYEMAARQVAAVLGLEFAELPEYGCCGFPIRSASHKAWLLMAGRNLALAERMGADVVTLCSSCGSALTEAAAECAEHPEMLEEVNRGLKALGNGLKYSGKVKVNHFARLLHQKFGHDGIAEKVKRPLEGLKVTVHYGCHYVKPSKVFSKYDDPEDPKSLDDLVRATGAESVPYEEKLRCCGGSILAYDLDLAHEMARRKLLKIGEAGADLICLVCPFCSVMYDDNQKQIAQKFEDGYQVPVLYYPQLLGLAMGLDAKSLGLKLNKVKTKSLLERIGA